MSDLHVLLVDDHPLIAESLARHLRDDPGIADVRRAASVAEAREQMVDHADVVVLDYELPDGLGIDLIPGFRERGTHVLMFTARSDDAAVLEAVRRGAEGYLPKDRASGEDVAAAVARLARGEMALPEVALVELSRMVEAERASAIGERHLDPLSPRELEVLRLLAEGLDAEAIEKRLTLSHSTVKTHLNHVFEKLGAHTKLEAVAIGLRNRLIEPPHGPRTFVP